MKKVCDFIFQLLLSITLCILNLGTLADDCCRLPIILPRENESVLLGASILGAVAAKKFSSLNEAMRAMNAAGQVHKFFFS